MLRSVALFAWITLAAAIAVPWYWSFLPWSEDASYHGIRLNVFVSACAVAVMTLTYVGLALTQRRQRFRAIKAFQAASQQAHDHVAQLRQKVQKQRTDHADEIDHFDVK